MDKCPTIMMKVLKNLYLEESESNFRWFTEKHENKYSYILKAGTVLAFRSYWYRIINPVTEEDKKNAMTIIMDKLDSVSSRKYPLGRIEIHPYELTDLIKNGAIEII